MISCFRKVFFNDPNFAATAICSKKKPTLDEVKAEVELAFQSIVGQKTAKVRLCRAATSALLRYDHNCSDINFLVTGPASVGKTSIVRTFASVLKIPYLEVSPRSLNSLDDMFNQIAQTLASFTPAMPLDRFADTESKTYMASPMVIFVDEAHALAKQMQDGLLKAIESDDRTLQTETGRTLICKNVCWIFATTEAGDLFGPLLSSR